MNLFNESYRAIMASLTLPCEPVDLSNIRLVGGFENAFMEVLREGSTYRTDNLGNKVEIPTGHGFKIGPDGFGIAVGPCDKATVDRVGRLHVVPKGYKLKMGKNGKGVVVTQGDSTREKKGQLHLVKPPTKK